MWEWVRWLFGRPASAYAELAERESAASQVSQPGRFYYLSLNFEDQKWSIHGLWPQNSATSYPQYCRTVQFDPRKLAPILPQRRRSWTSNRGSDEVFWRHEWEKHGSCMFNNCDEFEYFNKALELFNYVLNEGLVSKYKTSGTTSMVPFDLAFKVLPPQDTAQ